MKLIVANIKPNNKMLVLEAMFLQRCTIVKVKLV
jgi:hypothetical protein